MSKIDDKHWANVQRELNGLPPIPHVKREPTSQTTNPVVKRGPTPQMRRRRATHRSISQPTPSNHLVSFWEWWGKEIKANSWQGALVGAVILIPLTFGPLILWMSSFPDHQNLPSRPSRNSSSSEVMTESERDWVVDHMVGQGADRTEADAFTRALNEAQRQWEADN